VQGSGAVEAALQEQGFWFDYKGGSIMSWTMDTEMYRQPRLLRTSRNFAQI
jgi:hypothetical protein